MNELKIFQRPEFGQIRTLEIESRVWFGATDVASALGYTNPRKAIIDHCKSHGVTICDVIDSMGRNQQMKFINEGNVYRLIASSQLPQAEKFESWVFDELVPTVMTTGGYIATQNDESPDEIMARAIMVAQETIKKREQRIATLEQEKQKLQPKADFADAAFKAVDSKIDIGQAAKILNLGFGRNTLFKKLKEAGVFFTNRNEPKQKYINAGYFEMTELPPIERNNHSPLIVMKVLVTQKGLAYINKLFGGDQNEYKLTSII